MVEAATLPTLLAATPPAAAVAVVVSKEETALVAREVAAVTSPVVRPVAAAASVAVVLPRLLLKAGQSCASSAVHGHIGYLEGLLTSVDDTKYRSYHPPSCV